MDKLVEGVQLIRKLNENSGELVREIEKLIKVDLWARSQLHIKEDDAVVLKRDIEATGGWYCYREILVEGSTGIATNIFLYNGAWRCYFTTDVSWSVSDYPKPLTRHASRAKTFMLPIDSMRKRTEHDIGLTMPEDAIPYKDYGLSPR